MHKPAGSEQGQRLRLPDVVESDVCTDRSRGVGVYDSQIEPVPGTTAVAQTGA